MRQFFLFQNKVEQYQGIKIFPDSELENKFYSKEIVKILDERSCVVIFLCKLVVEAV